MLEVVIFVFLSVSVKVSKVLEISAGFFAARKGRFRGRGYKQDGRIQTGHPGPGPSVE